jgi:hypothetical protein
MLAIKTQGGVEVYLHTFLLSMLVGIKLSASLLRHFNPLNKRQLSWFQSWSGHFWRREKYLAPARNQTRIPLSSPAHNLVTILSYAGPSPPT